MAVPDGAADHAGGMAAALTERDASPGAVDGVASTGGRSAPATPRRHAPPKRVRALLALLVVFSIAIGVWALRPAPGTQPLVASGTLEVEEVTLSAETAGRLQELTVDEGS